MKCIMHYVTNTYRNSLKKDLIFYSSFYTLMLVRIYIVAQCQNGRRARRDVRCHKNYKQLDEA